MQSRGTSNKKWWVIGGVVVLLFVVVSCAQEAPQTTPATGTATNVGGFGTKTTPTLAHTSTPKSTPTPTKQSTPVAVAPTLAPTSGAAILGALVGTFVAKYGQPNACSNPPMYVFKRSTCGTGPAAGVSILVLDDGHGHNRVQSISNDAPIDVGWDATTARAECLQFLPDDAHLIKRIDEASASGTTGYVLRYSSSTISQEFTPDQFSDGQGNTTPQGVFEVAFVYGNGSAGTTPSDRVDWCDIGIGEQGATSFA